MADSEIYIPNCKIFRHDKDENGGGVAFYVAHELKADWPQDTEKVGLKSLWIMVNIKREICQVGVIYRPPLN